jgi:hypothetical protein
MKNESDDTVRLRFRIDFSEQLGNLLMDGYSRDDFSRRMENLIRTFNVAMYQRVIRSRETGFLAPAAWFNVNLGPEIIRVHVVVDPLNASRVTMDFARADTSGASQCYLN